MSLSVDSSSTDALSAVLSQTRVRGTIFSHTPLRAPWGLRSTGSTPVVCFSLLRGHAVLSVKETHYNLTANDLVMVRPGTKFTLRATRGCAALPFEQFIAALPHTGSGEESHIVCGAIEFDGVGEALVTTALPPVLWLRDAAASHAQRAIVEALAAEVRAPGPGTSLVLSRLAELLFFRALRACVDERRGTRWLRGLAHEKLSRALTAMHLHPEHPWTLETLAEQASMSRASFAATFRREVGDTPQAWLTHWRMLCATRLLRGETPIKEIATAVGYGSDEAFGRAFRTWSGVTPGAWRRNSLDAPS